MSAFWEKRPCTKCGYVRRVCVNLWKDHREEGSPEKEHWNKLCTICSLLDRAEIHRRAARDFEKRATEMRMMRNARDAAKARKNWSPR